jgi:hypothetical protein
MQHSKEKIAFVGFGMCSLYANIETPRSESARELHRPRDRCFSAKLVTTLACHVVSVADPCGRILGFLDRSRYFFFQVAPQLYSRGSVDPVPDPLLLRTSSILCDTTGVLSAQSFPVQCRPIQQFFHFIWHSVTFKVHHFK